ncbi:GlxA family transcriptional regulator [Paraburkholderia caballeronis]|uniref:GlxA family transcriptional regulator n=1 Tax=Paraburkholderia caballeronis TaxID=416943 RepID=UPI0010669C20|nr:GlxA family transcriptional regulator [Paraburkholderia caballeronis]TDV07177.1 AraC family transcriptional regulator with amidase-like domain [Paraburkholderia caballeronis]TDV11321.1 AraC family transcriptional regulator with amidase-like domain [Paraburkholderia caballeronis]TDV22506.1 AraC family transcriptional regulator with amidase-like domain [Paraburkholderia caballeronis]
MTTIAILIFPGVQALDVTGPLDVFAEANRFLLPHERFELEILGTEDGQIRCSNGLDIRAHRLYATAPAQYDLLLVAGGPVLPGAKFDESLYAWLRDAAERCAGIGSICNGAFVLARAGLLDGRRVTTHWNDAAALALECPSAILCADHLYVQDGKLVTSAGVTAGIDMSLYLLARERGRELALNVAKRLLLFSHRAGGQSQFSPYLTPYVEPTSAVAQVQQYVLVHLREDLSLAVLASVANMSVRNLTRVFARDAQTNPSDFVESARLDAARVLLETTGQPVKTIAYECGFGDAHRMRAVFRRRLGLSPQEYRAHFLEPAARSAQS